MFWERRKIAGYEAKYIVKRVFGEDDEGKIEDLKTILETVPIYTQVYKRKTLWNNIAYCVLFLVLLVIAPFQWLVYRDFGLSVNNRFGWFCLRLIGED